MRSPRLVLFAFCAPGLLIPACSDNDTTQGVYNLDASQTPIPSREAGASCLTDTDCVSGLVCLYPATSCDAFKECTTPSDPCPAPQPACSCIGDPIQVCNGFTTEPFAALGDCADGGVVATPEAGSTSDDAGDAAPPVDAAVADASDAATDG